VKRGAKLAFVDESAILMQPLVRRTWSKRGRTPIYRQKMGSHRKITAIGAIVSTATGRNPKLKFRLHPRKNATADVCVAYLEQLKVTVKGPVVVLWDNLGAHHSKKVKRWIERNPRFSLENFPPYAPELNPIEYGWAYLKQHRLANFAPQAEEDLRLRAKAEFCRVRREPRILRSFLHRSGLFKPPKRQGRLRRDQ
jgi:transposase